MDGQDDLERRVGALEDTVQDLGRRVRRSEQDAAAARILAGGADRDVSEVRSEMREFRTEVRDEFAAVRTEMRAEFAAVRTEMRDEFAAVRGEAAEYRTQNNRVLNAMRADLTDLREHVDRGFLQIRGMLDAAAAGQQRIVDLIGTLISREDR